MQAGATLCRCTYPCRQGRRCNAFSAASINIFRAPPLARFATGLEWSPGVLQKDPLSIAGPGAGASAAQEGLEAQATELATPWDDHPALMTVGAGLSASAIVCPDAPAHSYVLIHAACYVLRPEAHATPGNHGAHCTARPPPHLQMV